MKFLPVMHMQHNEHMHTTVLTVAWCLSVICRYYRIKESWMDQANLWHTGFSQQILYCII